MSEPQFSAELLSIYVEDARVQLDALDRCLFDLERGAATAPDLAEVLGPLHTLKGNSGMVGFAGVKDYVHRLEDVVERLRDGTLAASAAVCDTLLAGANALRGAVEAAVQAGTETRALGPEILALDALLRAGAAAPAQPARAAALPASEAAQAMTMAPSAPASADAAPTADARPRAESDAGPRSSMVRVDFAQLDQLLNLVGELVIHRTKLHEAGRALAGQLADSGAARDLLEAVQQVERVSGELQSTVMDVRMLPIRHVFGRFPRLVRDLARAQGKDVELILEGEATRVDKAIIDEIGEPLVHLLRNSVDHGIEPPEARVRQGKTRTGTILLAAAQESNHVVITVMDDGAGIDAAQVRSKALRRGLLHGHETLTERETVQLIFAPGFSTAEAVTDVSGRGVGLDVVMRAAERLNGLVEVESVPGVGTKFVVQLPLTLAIIATLLVDAGGESFAVPLSAVVESVRFGQRDVQGVGGRPTLRIRERIVPLVDLAALLGRPPLAPRPERHAVVLGRGDRRLALAVDRLRGQQEVVIKGLDPAVKTPAVAGATIMGDGRVVLILDVPALFEFWRQGLHGERQALAQAGA